MNQTSQWFSNQLQSTLEGLIWSARQIPPERWLQAPPEALGEWTAARHMFHMVFYEAKIGLPSMRIWLGEPIPDVYVDEEKAWVELADKSLDSLCESLTSVRQQQRALLPNFQQADWDQERMTGWDEVSLYWVVSKTFQHTAEHTHDIMAQVLFWDWADLSKD